MQSAFRPARTFWIKSIAKWSAALPDTYVPGSARGKSATATLRKHHIPPNAISQKMRYFLLSFSFLIFSPFNFGDADIQEYLSINNQPRIKLDPIYFVLGTLSDYMGRFYYVNKKDQIDRYYAFEVPLINELDSILQHDLKIKIKIESSNGIYETFNQDLALTLNSFYTADKKLNVHKFKDTIEIYSFLTGRFYRYGTKLNDSIYKIQMANASNAFLNSLLFKKIGCSNVGFKYLKHIPAQYIDYFTPTKQLDSFFDLIESQKKRYDASYDSLKIRPFENNKKDYKRFMDEYNSKEIQNAIQSFKEQKDSNLNPIQK